MGFGTKLYLLDGRDRNHSIEGLRGLAVLMVLNVHFFAQYYVDRYNAGNSEFLLQLFRTLHAGHIGVDIFFVISGFLIWKILFIEKRSYRQYIMDRIARLMPTYGLNLLIAAVTSFSLTKFLENFLFLPQFIPGIEFYNYVAWTLAWEWLFYLLLVLIARLTGRNKRKAILLVGVVFCILFIFSYVVKQSFLEIPDALRFSGFLIGCLVSELHSKLRSSIFQSLGWASLPAIFLASYLWGGWAADISREPVLLGLFYLVVDIAAASLLIFLLNFRSVYRSIFEWKGLRVVGQISYTFYLSHTLLGIPISNQIFPVYHSVYRMLLSYLITLVVTFVISSFLFYLTERQYLVRKPKLAATRV